MSTIVPEPSDMQVADDLYDLTELLAKSGYDTSGGLLGGEYGYGAWVDNDVFMMHPYCWCESDECPWCAVCTCPDGAWVYRVRGERVSYETWVREYDLTGNRERSHYQDWDLACALCREILRPAANFLHKPSGTTVHWYKYIGRSMEVDARADWTTLIAECRSVIDRPAGDAQ